MFQFRLRVVFVSILTLPLSGAAQWLLQDSHTTDDLYGIHFVGDGIAWASGSNGTVLRTADDGDHWQRCATPPEAEALDFRGIQAFDANIALVMSSGPGSLSRVYKTMDGCVSWKLVFTNPDAPNGSFKAIQFIAAGGRDKGRIGDLIGDPVRGEFAQFRTYDYGQSWSKTHRPWVASAREGEAPSAASNSSLIEVRGGTLFVTEGSACRSRTEEEYVKHDPSVSVKYVGGDIPVGCGKSAGAVSVAARLGPDDMGARDAAKYIVRVVHTGDVLVAVGGDPRQPDRSIGTCAISLDGSLRWSKSETPPHGFRSSVAYDAPTRTWISVGPNGTDTSTDDGRNWHSIIPEPTDAPDSDRKWSALSLPFVVGPMGRIGKLRSSVFTD
jgi:hypothetical protein